MVQCLCLVMFSLSWQWCTQCYYSTLWRHEKKKKSSWIRINRFCWAYLKKKKKKNILCPYSSFPPTLEQNKGLKREILSCAHKKQCFFCFCLCPLHITQTNIQKRHVPNSIIMCALFSSWTVKSHSTWEIENWGHLLLISINQILVITVDENKY